MADGLELRPRLSRLSMMYYDVYDVEPHVFCPRKPNVHDATRSEAGTNASVTFSLASRHRRLAVTILQSFVRVPPYASLTLNFSTQIEVVMMMIFLVQATARRRAVVALCWPKLMPIHSRPGNRQLSAITASPNTSLLSRNIPGFRGGRKKGFFFVSISDPF